MRVYLEGHGPLQNHPTAKVPWEDVRVRYARPTKRRKYLGHDARTGIWAPVLIGGGDLEGDIYLERMMIRKYGTKPWITSSHLELAELLTVRKLLKTRRRVVGPEGPGGASLYSRKRLIGRREAEALIRDMLEQRLPTYELDRLRPIRFVWVRTKITVGPISIPAPGRIKK